LSGDERQPPDPCFAIRVRQLLALGAELPDEVSGELEQFLAEWRLTPRGHDFPARVAVADLTLAEKLQDIDQDATSADVAATYNKVFTEGSAPDQRKQVVARIAVLATLVGQPGNEALTRLADDLTTWSTCR